MLRRTSIRVENSGGKYIAFDNGRRIGEINLGETKYLPETDTEENLSLFVGAALILTPVPLGLLACCALRRPEGIRRLAWTNIYARAAVSMAAWILLFSITGAGGINDIDAIGWAMGLIAAFSLLGSWVGVVIVWRESLLVLGRQPLRKIWGVVAQQCLSVYMRQDYE
ncbi:hypothetical protein [Propionibacterium freudenreichii]|uniref:hypothetical protein n=1 Tax=Propionibacterium freudenreichii TaxID=1744 RepID=UPI0005A2F862|nr:hypothetical protein [Propionibacterium freudenreichii]PWM98515.1 MAG: hypothetical protein DBX96_05230 [Propionibacterium sp.]ARO11591.1 hypothetical protein BMR99_02745 [Propionibacterium freudenreichii]MCQ1996985.1 hypothetical protein [Propionibacterium freudenreichii]MCT2988047.1 hypothetical protein [Propionibacterium freudenreichii]MCT3006975.1 hypothetical protein [Propionibacterium freudenreichii]